MNLLNTYDTMKSIANVIARRVGEER